MNSEMCHHCSSSKTTFCKYWSACHGDAASLRFIEANVSSTLPLSFTVFPRRHPTSFLWSINHSHAQICREIYPILNLMTFDQLIPIIWNRIAQNSPVFCVSSIIFCFRCWLSGCGDCRIARLHPPSLFWSCRNWMCLVIILSIIDACGPFWFLCITGQSACLMRFD